jgi:hypothetical protein
VVAAAVVVQVLLVCLALQEMTEVMAAPGVHHLSQVHPLDTQVVVVVVQIVRAQQEQPLTVVVVEVQVVRVDLLVQQTRVAVVAVALLDKLAATAAPASSSSGIDYKI